MKVLVVNAGSSSLKFQLISTEDNTVITKGCADGIGLDSCTFEIKDSKEQVSMKDHNDAIAELFKHVSIDDIDAIGHRVVHGGDKYSEAVLVDETVTTEIENCCALAPLHNPASLLGIKACKTIAPNTPQVVVFDTAFHQTVPESLYKYAIPNDISEKLHVRKYGFHGTSHKYLTKQMQKILGKEKVSLIICHLGNGASCAAIKDGKVFDTSMGLTPLAGLIMGTRCGDIDPEAVPYLMKHNSMSTKEVLTLLNKKSGLLGLTGCSDMRDVYNKSKEGDKNAQLAINMYSERLIHYIGAYYAKLGPEPIDAIVFSAGTGQGAFYIREKVCERMAHLGISLDKEQNNQPWITKDTKISSTDSKVGVYVIPTDEEVMIATETAKIVGE